jgi:hypothetical protein
VPPWLEILLDLIGYAGFIAFAMRHKPRGEDDGMARQKMVMRQPESD